jgi:hypothetical protein
MAKWLTGLGRSATLFRSGSRPCGTRFVLQSIMMTISIMTTQRRGRGAAAIAASQIPGGPVVGADDGPKCLADGTMPALPVELRALAVHALDRVVGDR